MLEHLECDALRASAEARLGRSDIKLIARNILEALKAFHKEGIAHTGRGSANDPFIVSADE